LQEALQNEYLCAEYPGHGNKKHHSRKKHSSVSSRQREGGSLPCNVNDSTSATASFLKEVSKRSSKSKNKTDYGTIAMPSETTESVGANKDELQTGEKTIRQRDTIIDIEEGESDETKHLLAHDSLAQVVTFIHLVFNSLQFNFSY
jgi:hypothetical protein